jgi:hypothetical protein
MPNEKPNGTRTAPTLQSGPPSTGRISAGSSRQTEWKAAVSATEARKRIPTAPTIPNSSSFCATSGRSRFTR